MEDFAQIRPSAKTISATLPADAAGGASTPATQDGLHDLGDPEVWRRGWYRGHILDALRNDGVSDAVLDVFRAWMAEFDPRTFAEFRDAARVKLAGPDGAALSPDVREGLSAAIDYLDEVIRFNTDIYSSMSTPEQIKRYQWPNSGKMLVTNWHAYADIMAMDFHVDTHRIVTPETAIVSSGSCFAWNIARQLQHLGYNYLIEMGKKPHEIDDPGKYEFDSARCGGIFNAASMRQMVERAFGEWTPEKLVLRTEPVFVDPFRGKPDYADVEGYHRDFDAHNAALNRAMSKCDVFVCTLGMSEAWYFAHTGAFTYASPRTADNALLRRKIMTVEDNVTELERMVQVFRRYRPSVHIVLTLSPVPLNRTFVLDRNVVVANSHSKAVLRCAIETIVRRHPDMVSYFPAFEYVTYGTAQPWESDRRHVNNDAVRRVMKAFQRQYMVDQTEQSLFCEPALETKINTHRSYTLYWARRIGRPIKKRLGIQGSIKKHYAAKWTRFVDWLHPPL